eukprot:2439302-Pleurochrysis_carterae.AAC.1
MHGPSGLEMTAVLDVLRSEGGRRSEEKGEVLAATARNVRRSDPGSGKEWQGVADPISDGEGRTGRERERR